MKRSRVVKPKKKRTSAKEVSSARISDWFSILLKSIHVHWQEDKTRPGLVLSFLGRDGDFYGSIVRYRADGSKCVVFSRRANSVPDVIRLLSEDFVSGIRASTTLQREIEARMHYDPTFHRDGNG